MMYEDYIKYSSKEKNWPYETTFVSKEKRDQFKNIIEKDIMFSYLLRFLINYSAPVFVISIGLVWFFYILSVVYYIFPLLTTEGQDNSLMFLMTVAGSVMLFIVSLAMFNTCDGYIINKIPFLRNFINKYLKYSDFHYQESYKFYNKKCTYYQLLLKLYDAKL